MAQRLPWLSLPRRVDEDYGSLKRLEKGESRVICVVGSIDGEGYIVDFGRFLVVSPVA